MNNVEKHTFQHLVSFAKFCFEVTPLLATCPSQMAGTDTSLVADVHQTERDASLVADARQSRGIGEQGADEPLSTSNPPGSRSDNSGSSSPHPPTFNPVLFDSSSVTSESEYTFDTHQIITDYLEKHFRVSHKGGTKPHA